MHPHRQTKQTSPHDPGWGVGGGVWAGSSDILRALEKIENKKPTFRKTPLILMEALREFRLFSGGY